MELYELVDLATDYTNLGWAVQEQLQAVVDGEDLDDQNPNALSMIAGFLKRAGRLGVEDATDLEKDITDYLGGEV